VDAWFVPIVSAIALAEWSTLAWLRYHDRDTMTAEQARHRLSLLDVIIVVVCIGLLASAMQYPGLATSHDIRVALGIVRVALVGSGAYLLVGELRAPARGR